MNNLIIEIKKHNGINVVSSKTIAEQLGKKHSHVMSKIKEVLGVAEFSEREYKDSRGKPQPELMITKYSLKKLLSRYRYVAPEQYKALGVEDIDVIHTYTRFEVSFCSMLEEALKELNIDVVKQYNIDGYRIDFYIPSLNIAVEYDEAQHFIKTNIKKDNDRQSYIERKLDCKFIRCDYRDSNIKNTMKVLKELM